MKMEDTLTEEEIEKRLHWKQYVKNLERQGLDSIATHTENDKVLKEDDISLKKGLDVTHHFLERYVEIFPDYRIHLPYGIHAHLNQHEYKLALRLTIRALRQFVISKKISMPFNTAKPKFLKYGAVDSIYYFSPEGIVFTIIREAKHEIIVTCHKPTKDRQSEYKADPLFPDSSGEKYLEDISKIYVPYRVKKSVITNDGPIKITQTCYRVIEFTKRMEQYNGNGY